MHTPQVSVLMPVYNGQKHLKPAIESILDQSFRDFELLVVDDGSTDASGEIVRTYAATDARIRLISQANQGIVGALNNALFAARGELCARMDADDVSAPDRLAAQVQFLEANRAVTVVGGHGYIIDDDGDPVRPFPVVLTDDEITAALLRERSFAGRTHLIHPAVMFRRGVACEIGGYRQEFIWAEDRDFFLRMGESGQLANLDKTILHYRQSGGSVSNTRAELQQDNAYNTIVKARIRRKLPVMPEASIRWAPSKPVSPTAYSIYVATVSSEHGNMQTARKHVRRALAAAPMSADVWRTLLLVGKSGLDAIGRPGPASSNFS